MKTIILLIFFILSVNALDTLTGTEIETCLRCICFSATYCQHWNHCVESSINQTYWEVAGSPTVNNEEPSPKAYRNCMKDVNCILNTMNVYTSVGGANRDANCDGKFNCKDRLAVHFNGHTDNYTLKKYRVIRFDSCATANKIPNEEGWSGCDLKTINDVFNKSIYNLGLN